MDKETFDATQAKRIHFNLTNRKIHNYPLKDKMFCGCCRHDLSLKSSQTACYLYRHSTSIEGLSCNGMKISSEELELAIFEPLNGQIEQLICPNGILDSVAASIEKASEYEHQFSDSQLASNALWPP